MVVDGLTLHTVAMFNVIIFVSSYIDVIKVYKKVVVV